MEKINNYNKRKSLIIGGIIIFFGIIFIYNLVKLGVFNQDTQKPKVLNNKIVFEQPKLTIFDETRYINQFPDTIHIHYPNFIVVVPEDSKQITSVYSLTEKHEVASYNDIVLDYYNGNFLYNYHGGNTFYNGKNLNIHCNQGFIKSDKVILCVIQNSNNPMNSNLISINPKTLAENTLYSPQNAITAIYYDNNTIYLGEYNYNSHKAFLTINGKKTKVDTFISIIYPIQNNMYFATLKNTENNLAASYTQIIFSNNNLSTNLINKASVVFYK